MSAKLNAGGLKHVTITISAGADDFMLIDSATPETPPGQEGALVEMKSVDTVVDFYHIDQTGCITCFWKQKSTFD